MDMVFRDTTVALVARVYGVGYCPREHCAGSGRRVICSFLALFYSLRSYANARQDDRDIKCMQFHPPPQRILQGKLRMRSVLARGRAES